ncbi:hypothetical protein DL768_000676 [Monosporascus sp. mg162]|nr:hypothetical protein DL768_000676 [Monosporascus sp. mg162]
MDDKVQRNKRKYSSFTGISKDPMELAGHNAAASPGSTPSRRVPGATGTALSNATGTRVAASLGLTLSGHTPEATRTASTNASGPNATALPGSMVFGHAPEATGTAIPNVSGTSAPIGQDLQELQMRAADLTQQSRAPVSFSHGLPNVQTTGMGGSVSHGENESSGRPHLSTQNVGAQSNTNLNATQGHLASTARQTASGNDVPSSSGTPEPRVFPGLGHVDLRNPSDLKVFKSLLEKSFILDLFRSTDKDDGCTIYTVQRFSNFNKLLCRQRGEETTIFEHSQQSVWSEVPAVLELDGGKPASSVLPFPRYVLDLGEVFVWKRCAETGQKQQRSSGFHLVMDVTRLAKPLWLVYRYQERDLGLGHHLDLNTAYKRDPVWHPFAAAAGIEFDSALVFTSAAHWKEDMKYDGFAAVVDLVKRTGMVRKPTFVEPVLEEVKQEIAKGWA